MTDRQHLRERLAATRRYAEIDANAYDHVLSAWETERTGRADKLQSVAYCMRCRADARVVVDQGAGDERYGNAVLFRCVAVPGNRCEEASGWEPDGSIIEKTTDICTRPYLTVWKRNEPSLPGTLKLCLRHSRAYRYVAATNNPNGWHQVHGPTDYGDDPRQWRIDTERRAS